MEGGTNLVANTAGRWNGAEGSDLSDYDMDRR